jgi:hypothetical protein
VKLEAEQAFAADDVPDTPLNGIKAHGTARLALEMVDNSTQGLELDAAAEVRAVIENFLV